MLSTGFFRALGDPTRRHIIELLCDGDATVSFIAEPLPMSLAMVTRHVHALERRGLIRTHKIGRVRTCWLEPEALRQLEEWVRYQRSRWERHQRRV
ncbi:MAG: winged helix-turn-helix transcriptional regulator [Gammaproteobacteria bacterium]|nr:MAG: winged helix-turn-helix transcriptional regulator [Gammaproteobacteria bacterium]